MRTIIPETVAKPGSAYAHGVVHRLAGERLVVAGQVGVALDGSVSDDLEAQADQAWANVFAIMKDAGFERRHLVRAIAYVTVPGQVGVYRRARDRALQGHLAANTYIEVSGLASPKLLVEIEVEAIKEA